MLFDYTKLGGQVTLETAGIMNYTSGMPAYGDLLNDEEIWEILSYIRSTWPLHIQEAHATRHPMKLAYALVLNSISEFYPTRRSSNAADIANSQAVGGA